MSTILEALKKAEQSTPVREALPKSTASASDQIAVQPPQPQGRTTSNWSLSILLCVVGSLGTILVYEHRISQDPVPTFIPSHTVKEKSVEQETTDLQINKRESLQDITKQINIQANSPVTETIFHESSPKIKTAINNKIKNEAPPVKAPIEETVTLQKMDYIETASDHEKIVTKPLENRENKVIHETPVQDDEIIDEQLSSVREELPILGSDILKLQAITWSPEAEKRFIVINNTISRIRDIVDGYHITQINMDSIIVQKRDNNKKWLVKFRTR